jgi:excisionase family DNA binding protein
MDRVAVCLPDGKWALFTVAELETALARAAEVPALAPRPGAHVALEPERMVTSAEAAALCGVGSTTLEAMAADGRIRAHRFGRELRALRFLPSEVAEDTRSIPTPQRRLK